MEEVKQKSVSEIIRETAYNQSEFLTRIAIHIDTLEQENAQLKIENAELLEKVNRIVIQPY